MDADHLLLKGDTKDIIEAILYQDSPPTAAIRNSIKEARDLLQHYDSWNLVFIPRSENFLTHNLAKWATVSRFEGLIPFSLVPPHFLMRDEEMDKLRGR